MIFSTLMRRVGLNLIVTLFLSRGFICTSTGAPAPGTPEPPPEVQSPRLRALASALHSGETAALDSFWAEVDKTHSPLIERIADRPHDELFTFLWHAQPDQTTLNVMFN